MGSFLDIIITYSFASGDLEDLGGQADGAFDTELLILSTIDQIGRDYVIKCSERNKRFQWR